MDRQLQNKAAYEHAHTDKKERSTGRCEATRVEIFLKVAKKRSGTHC